MSGTIDLGSCQLTFEELERLHRSLIRYRQRLGDPNIVAAGFGVKERAGRRSPRHRMAARFLVRHKKTPRRTSHRLPTSICLRLRQQNGNYRMITLPTDVEQTGDRFEWTGTSVTAGRSGTSGVTLAWLPRGLPDHEPHWRWGLFTAGHLAEYHSLPVPARIRRLEAGPDSPSQIAGVIRHRTMTAQSFDAAVIESDRVDLLLSGFIPDPSVEYLLRDNATLAVDAAHKAKGKTFRARELGPRDFRVKSFHPDGESGKFDNLKRVLVVEGRDQDFAPGTSGSLWTIDGMPAAIQVGAFAPDYRMGVGQSLVSGLFEWAKPRLNAARIIVSHVF